MGKTEVPGFETRPERGPIRVERTPVDRFAELKRKLLTEGRSPLVSADVDGMEDEFREIMEARGFSFEVFTPEQSGGGKNYEIQRENLVKVVGEPTVEELEEWGEQLFEAAKRNS